MHSAFIGTVIACLQHLPQTDAVYHHVKELYPTVRDAPDEKHSALVSIFFPYEPAGEVEDAPGLIFYSTSD